MKPPRFWIQTGALVLLAGAVQLPAFRPLRTVTVWGAGGPLAPRPERADEDPRLLEASAGGGIMRIGYGSLASSARGGAARATSRPSGLASALTTSGAGALGAEWNALVCHARTSLNQPVAFGRLVLRDAETGTIEARAVADREGRCTFLDLRPGRYVLELVAGDGSVLASSSLLAIENGALRDATVFVGSDAVVPAVIGTVTPGAPTVIDDAINDGTPIVAPPVATNSPQQ